MMGSRSLWQDGSLPSGMHLYSLSPLMQIKHSMRRKVSKNMSFFTLKDTFGTAQLVARFPRSAAATGDSLPGSPVVVSRNIIEDLSSVPKESTILVQGTVKTRPQQAQRDVSNALAVSFGSFYSHTS